MPAGLQVIMDQGVLQLDSSMKTSTLVFKATYSGPYSNDGNTAYIGTWYQFDITIPSTVKLLFFASPAHRTIALFKKVGTTHTYRTNITGSIEFYGFADAPTTSSSRSGMQLFDENGVLTFDSESLFMRVADAFTAAPTLTLRTWPDAGKKYAAGLGANPKRWLGAYMNGAPWGIFTSYALSLGPTQVGAGEARVGSRPWGGGGVPAPTDTPAQPPPTVLVVDVTNM